MFYYQSIAVRSALPLIKVFFFIADTDLHQNPASIRAVCLSGPTQFADLTDISNLGESVRVYTQSAPTYPYDITGMFSFLHKVILAVKSGNKTVLSFFYS